MERVFESGILIPYLTQFECFTVSLTCRAALAMRPKIIRIDCDTGRSRYMVTADGKTEWLSGYSNRMTEDRSAFSPETFFNFHRSCDMIISTVYKMYEYIYSVRSYHYNTVYEDRNGIKVLRLDFKEYKNDGDTIEVRVCGNIVIRNNGIRISYNILDYLLTGELTVSSPLVCNHLDEYSCMSKEHLFYREDENERLKSVLRRDYYEIEVTGEGNITNIVDFYTDEVNGYTTLIPYNGYGYTEWVYGRSYLLDSNGKLCIPKWDGQEKLDTIYKLIIPLSFREYPYGGEYSVSSIRIREATSIITLTKSRVFEDRIFYIDVYKNLDIYEKKDRVIVSGLYIGSHINPVHLDMEAPKGFHKELIGEYYRYYILE